MLNISNKTTCRQGVFTIPFTIRRRVIEMADPTKPIHALTDNELLGTVGEQLRKLREARGFTQTEAAEKADISRPTLMRAEKGENISMRTLIHLLRIYGRIEALENLLQAPEVSREEVLGE
jgi:DNA-binding XRE family transcriptional regulator